MISRLSCLNLSIYIHVAIVKIFFNTLVCILVAIASFMCPDWLSYQKKNKNKKLSSHGDKRNKIEIKQI